MAKRSVEKGKETKSGEEVKKRRQRIVMKQEDRDTIRRNLMYSFRLCGASEAQALHAITKGSLPMEVWIQRYITHETDYVKAGLTEDNYRKGCFAWMYYKVTAETVTGLSVPQEVKDEYDRLQRRRLERIDKERNDA